MTLLEHSDDPQQQSHAQRDRYANSQDYSWDADDDGHRRQQVAGVVCDTMVALS